MNFANIHGSTSDLSDQYAGTRVRLVTGGDDNGMLGTILRFKTATIVVRRDNDKYHEYDYGYNAVETAKDEEYVDFGDVSRQQLDQQCQYGSRYIDGRIDGWPNLGKGLRFRGFDRNGHVNNYHAMKIHRDDVEEFVRRVLECQGEL